jgi:hypothetical protein
MRDQEQAYKTYCAFNGVNALDGERIYHAGVGNVFRSRKFLEQVIDVAVLGRL